MTQPNQYEDKQLRESILHVLVKHELNIDMSSKKDMDLIMSREYLYHRLSLMTSRPSTIELVDMLEQLITQKQLEARIDELTRHDFDVSDDYADREYVRECIDELNKELTNE